MLSKQIIAQNSTSSDKVQSLSHPDILIPGFSGASRVCDFVPKWKPIFAAHYRGWMISWAAMIYALGQRHRSGSGLPEEWTLVCYCGNPRLFRFYVLCWCKVKDCWRQSVVDYWQLLFWTVFKLFLYYFLKTKYLYTWKIRRKFKNRLFILVVS